MPGTPIIVTLTAIPPRFPNLLRKFRAIERQTLRPDFVELNIPRAYRRFPGEVPLLPPSPEWVHVHQCDVDFGPATKLLPTVKRWKHRPADLLVCDDDRLPDRKWVERLAAALKARPDDILTERGWNINDRFGPLSTKLDQPRAVPNAKGGRTGSYRLKRAASLGQWHPARQLFQTPGYVDVFEGFLGALVPSRAIPAEAFEIPDIVWTVDDVWLSGMAYLNGTKIWAHDTARPVYSDGIFDKVSSLRHFVHSGYGREDADKFAVEYLRREHDVWP
jgi:hypothetical protein